MGLSKNSTLPHAQIWEPTPDFKIAFYGYAEGLQIPKIWRKNLRPFSRYEFLKFGRKIDFFGVREFPMGQKSYVDASWSRLNVCQIWSASVEEKVLLRTFNCLSLCNPRDRADIYTIYIVVKGRQTESV